MIINQCQHSNDEHISYYLFKCCFGKFGTASGFPTSPP